MTDFHVDPKRTALINIDMQNCFVENSPVAAPRGMEILPRINALADSCRAAGAAREANMRDFHVFFISDGTATFDTPEISADQIQPIVLATMKAAFVQVENTSSMVGKLAQQRGAARAA